MSKANSQYHRNCSDRALHTEQRAHLAVEILSDACLPGSTECIQSYSVVTKLMLLHTMRSRWELAAGVRIQACSSSICIGQMQVFVRAPLALASPINWGLSPFNDLFKLTQLIIWPYHGMNLARLMVWTAVKTWSKSHFISASLQGPKWSLQITQGGPQTAVIQIGEWIADWRQHRLAVEIETRLSTGGTSA